MGNRGVFHAPLSLPRAPCHPSAGLHERIESKSTRHSAVAAASWLLRFEARHATTAENETATTGGGIGPRSGLEAGLGLACPRADLGVAQPCLGLAASILSLLRRSDRRVRPPPGCRGAQPSLRPRGSFRLDRSAPAHPSAKPPCHGSPCRSDSTELRARPRFAWMGEE